MVKKKPPAKKTKKTNPKPRLKQPVGMNEQIPPPTDVKCFTEIQTKNKTDVNMGRYPSWTVA